jgi:hypothetical protein
VTVWRAVDMKIPESCKCPSCAGFLLFDIALQRLKCDHCSRELTVPEYDALMESRQTNSESRGAAPVQDGGYRRRQMRRSYVCSTCGGEVSPGVLSASGVCPFCEKPIVFTDKIMDFEEPDLIIPFMKEKKFFADEYRKLFTGRHFVPEDFLREAEAEKITARYFPFWLFDISAEGSAAAKAEKISKKGDKKWEHTVFELKGEGRQEFRGIPQDATDELDDALSQRLEPFDIAGSVPYSFAYFAGHDVRIGNRGSGKSFRDVERRVKSSLDDFLIPGKDYDACRITERSYRIIPGAMRYAIFPVYLLDIPWRKKIFSYAMNGQTGRIVGNFPVKSFNVGMCVLFFTCLTVLMLYGMGVLADCLPGMSQLLIFIPMILLIVGVCVVLWKSSLPFIFENNVLAWLGGFGSVFGTAAAFLAFSCRDQDSRIAVFILGFAAIVIFFGYHSVLTSRLEDEARDSLTGLAPNADAYTVADMCEISKQECRAAGSYVSESRSMRKK